MSEHPVSRTNPRSYTQGSWCPSNDAAEKTEKQIGDVQIILEKMPKIRDLVGNRIYMLSCPVLDSMSSLGNKHLVAIHI